MQDKHFVSRRTVLAIAAALGLLIVFVVGVRGSRGDYAAAGWFATLLLLVVDGLVAWHLLLSGGAKAIRRGALISVLATLALIGNCSATQVGGGSSAIGADPTAYFWTLAILVGPLLLVLAVPGLISIAPATPRREFWIFIASVLGGVAALVTAYAGFVLSYAVFCTSAHPTAAQSAQCVASSGSLAGIFGVIGPAMVLPPLLALMRRRAEGRSLAPPSTGR